MKITEVANGANDPKAIINTLKARSTPAPDVACFEKMIDVKQHEVFDKAKRPDKTVYPDSKEVIDPATGKTTIEKGAGKVEYVNRIGLAIQKLIIKRAASFVFGNPVIRNYKNDEEEMAKLLAEAIDLVLDDTKEDSLNRIAARTTFSYTEYAEYWFPIKKKEKHEDYGFETDLKLRCMQFMPDKNRLFPLFDSTGDMIAFSREFEVQSGEVKTTYFETYTDEEIILYKKSSLGGDWQEENRQEVKIRKIPIVYVKQDNMETEDVDDIISRLEKMFSNLGDTNDYHSAPKIFVNGKILSFGSKGSSNTVIQGEKDAKAAYLSWDHAPESWKLEAEQLIKFAFMITQTPDISFESVKGIGTLSGVALKLLFLDAHLKVKDKEEIFIPALQRRYKIIKSYLLSMNNNFKSASKLSVKPQIDPYMIADELMQAQVLQIAGGAKPFISQQEAVKQWGGDNEEYEQIQKEKKEDSVSNIFEPTE